MGGVPGRDGGVLVREGVERDCGATDLGVGRLNVGRDGAGRGVTDLGVDDGED